MGRRKESIFDVFTEISWQTSVTLAALVFITLRIILPLMPVEAQKFAAGKPIELVGLKQLAALISDS